MKGGLYMYRFQVNGTQHEVQEDQRLIDFLRADLKLTGTKEGCSAGACGTCTVIIDGKKAKACVTKLSQLDGKSVVTIEGLSEREKAVYTYAFGECGAVQCGFCIPGMIISAKVLIDVIENHDKHHDEYVARANDYLASLHPYNPINLAIYENELKRLFK